MAGPQLAFPSPSLSQPNQIGFRNMLVVTSTQNWVVPAGVTAAKVTVVGGGAGNTANLHGGGAGGTAIKMITGLVSGQVIPVTVGAQSSAGGAGNTSSFGSYCSATGGAVSIVGGIGVGGDINIRGGSGGVSYQYAYSSNCAGQPIFQMTWGAGGQSTHGAGGYSNFGNLAPTAGYQYGGGSSGGNAAGTGAQGVIIIEY